MNLYQEMNEKQKELLEEAGVTLENKTYNYDEVKKIENVIANYIFSKSKKEVSKISNKYIEILQYIDKRACNDK